MGIFHQLTWCAQRQKRRDYTPNVSQLEGDRRIKGLWDILFWDASPLGPKRRTVAILVVMLGILTFFLPLISTQPPVLHRSHWSPFDIVRQMYLGHLPQPICERCNEPIVRSCLALPFDVTLIYGLMLFALVVAWLRKSTTLAWTGILGVSLSLGTYMFRGGTNFATKWEFEKTFYGQPQSLDPSSKGPVLYGWLSFALLAVMFLFVLIAIRENIDKSNSSGTGSKEVN